MDFNISEEHKMAQEMAAKFAEKEIAPTMEEDEKEHKFRPDVLRKMAENGFFGCIAPEKYGGTEMGHLAATLMAIELAKVSPSWGLPFNLQMNGMQSSILESGTEEQKKKWIPPLISAETFGAFAITEANTGSDVASMTTVADEKDNCFVLNGNKMWISGVPYADVAIVYACTDKAAKPKHKGISAFLVDMHSPGIEQKAITTKLGLFCAPTGEIVFEDAEIPKDCLLGERGKGFYICMKMLNYTRLSSAARAVGVAEACIEHSVRYANERRQFGKPIAAFQMIQEQIARMYVEHECAKLLVYKAAWEKDQGMTNNTVSTSMAKYYAAESANLCADEAVKIFGSYGFSSEYPVERFYRDAKSYQIVEGTSNVQKMIISGFALKEK